MAFTHKITTAYAAGDGQICSVTDVRTADSEAGYDGTIPKGEAPVQQEVDVAIDVSKLAALGFYSDQAVTIHTNAVNGAGGNTLSIGAGELLAWRSNDPAGAACPLTLDVTKLYITNASAVVDAKVKLRWLVDVTP